MASLPDSVKLEVATPLGKELSLETDSVQVPSVSGQFGVLPGHLPLLAALRPGILTYKEDGQLRRAAVGGGYVEADATRVRLITEFFKRPEDVDLASAQKDLEAAQTLLKSLKTTVEDVAYQEAQARLDWALARIELLGGAAS